MREAKAFSPGGISSFFEICDTDACGNPIADLDNVGARGGGFGIQKGVTTLVSVSHAEKEDLKVFINGRNAPDAETTKTVARMLLSKSRKKCEVSIKHTVDVPIGAGFGSSAGGAVGTALALSKTMNLNLTYNQLGRIAHCAEVKCKTGLGTVGPLLLGGCIMTVEPGAPGVALIDRIPMSKDHVIVAATYGPISTRSVLSSPEKRQAVNEWGRKTLERILAKPSLDNFLASCKNFAEKTGFMTSRLSQLVRLAEKAGAIGAAQNMVGEAVHALTTLENAENVIEAFKQVLPQEKILVAKVDLCGARLVG